MDIKKRDCEITVYLEGSFRYKNSKRIDHKKNIKKFLLALAKFAPPHLMLLSLGVL